MEISEVLQRDRDPEWRPVPLPPEGDYEMFVVKATRETSKAGAPMVVVELKAVRPPIFLIREYLVETERTRAITEDKLGALGVTATGQHPIDPADLVGRSVCVRVVHEDFNGRLRPKVKRLLNRTQGTVWAGW